MSTHRVAAFRRIPQAELSADARKLGARPLAEILLATRYGGPEILRAVSCRYKTAARELEASGHEDMAVILDVQADAALLRARHIELGLRSIEFPPYLEAKT